MLKKVFTDHNFSLFFLVDYSCSIAICLVWHFYLSEQGCASPDHSELLSLQLTTQDSAVCGEEADFVDQATGEITAAQESEKEGDHNTAIMRYRTAVEILMKGVQGKEQ